MSWALVFAGAGAAAGLFSAVDTATQQRKIRQELREIKAYLIQLDHKLDEIEAQNREILRRLDELPAKIRQIVQEIVDIALLGMKYSDLKDVKDDLLTLGDRRLYRINQPGWARLSGTLTYLFDHENRLSEMLRLIAGCELALAASRNQGRPRVIKWITDKLGLIRALHADYARVIELELSTLLALLENKEFIATHNLSASLPDFSQLKYQAQPDRTRVVHYTERVCRSHGNKCGDIIEVCRDIDRTRVEPDHPFHKARNQHLAVIEERCVQIRLMLSKLGELHAVIVCFEKYLKRVQTLAVASSETTLFYHLPFAGTQAHIAGIEKISEDVDPAYWEYFDDVSDLDIPSVYTNVDVRENSKYFSVIQFRCPPV